MCADHVCADRGPTSQMVSPEVINGLGSADDDGDFELFKGAKNGGWGGEDDDL